MKILDFQIEQVHVRDHAPSRHFVIVRTKAPGYCILAQYEIGKAGALEQWIYAQKKKKILFFFISFLTKVFFSYLHKKNNQSTKSTDRLANVKQVATINVKLGWFIQEQRKIVEICYRVCSRFIGSVKLYSQTRSNSDPVQSNDFTQHSRRFTSQSKDMVMKKFSLFTFKLKQPISLE